MIGKSSSARSSSESLFRFTLDLGVHQGGHRGVLELLHCGEDARDVTCAIKRSSHQLSSEGGHRKTIKGVQIVKRSNANATGGERFVGDAHVGRCHVIEENLDQAAVDIAANHDGMPLIVPWGKLFVLRECESRGLVDDHDLATVGIRLSAQVAVIEVRRVLITEEDAAVAMIAGIFRAANTKANLAVAHFQVLDQGHVAWAAGRGLVRAATLGDLDDTASVFGSLPGPSFGIEEFPVLEIVDRLDWLRLLPVKIVREHNLFLGTIGAMGIGGRQKEHRSHQGRFQK